MKSILRLLVFVPMLTFAQTWQPVGTAENDAITFSGLSYGTSDSSDAVRDSNGNIYTAFRDNYFDSGITVKKYDGTSWQTVGSPNLSNGPVAYLQLAIATDNSLYVCYYDAATGTGKAQKFNGTTWEIIGGASFSESYAFNPDIAIAPNGTPYVAYQDNATANKISVKKFNGTTWEAVGGLGISSGLGSNVNLDVDSQNRPIVAFKDGSFQGKATVQRFNGSTWEILGSAGFTEGTVYTLSLALHNDIPYLAQAHNSNSGGILDVRHFNGSAWVFDGPASISYSNSANLSFSPSGVAYLSYMNGFYQTEVRTFDGTNWNSAGNILEDQSTVIITTFDASETPIIVYSNSRNGRRQTAKKLISNTWTATSSYADEGFHSYTGVRMATDASTGTIYAVYTDYSNFGFVGTIMKFDGSNWQSMGTLNGTVSYLYPDTAYLSVAAHNGTVYVSYPRHGDNKLSVEKNSGSGWTYVGNAGFTTNNVKKSKIMVSGSGIAFVSYIDMVSGKTNIRKFDGTNWITVGSADFSPGIAENMDMTLNQNGQPVVIYADATASYKASVQYFDGTTWQTAGTTGISNLGVANPHVACDALGNIYVIFSDNANASKAIVKKFDGTTWNLLGDADFTESGISNESILIGPDNMPYIAFTDASQMKRSVVMRFDGTDWNYVGQPVSAGSSFPEMVFDGNNLYVSYAGIYNGFVKRLDVTQLSLETFTNPNQLVLCPNPARDMVSLGTDASVMVYDLSGKAVLNAKTINGKINVSSLENGLYVVKTESDGKLKTAKLVKE
ncbi:T9SS type A sorting domain-containing protein [Flavobacterium silvaticum]|uniref:T9SS type A sorting domain-containing protein n=1 Tax=Flavobacterium silvaticum TaxID=1852020 RepID=A0A972FVS2_9FLAO|nr:T9SS type A sorting domain-containing protein [Flavobacterium silvaticum]NMH28520.1 T9SS type A sorting domain-containing protein [Flavobacterium silvaticum]